MHPTLLEIGPFVFHAYPTLLAVAFLVCTLLIVRDLNRQAPPIPLDTTAGVWAFFGALIGARAFCIVQYGSVKDLWRAILFWERGLVFYGGLIGGVLAVYLYAHRRRLPKLAVADAVAPYLALGEAITRIGCLLNGCCWGAVSALPWALCFPAGSFAFEQQVSAHVIAPASAWSAPVHPTQIYMTLGLILAFFVIRAARVNGSPTGLPVILYGILYGALRFTVECFRGDSARSVAGLTVSQSISVMLVVAGMSGLACMAWRRKGVWKSTKEYTSKIK